MFSKFEPKTRFDTFPELNKIAKHIQEFRVKKNAIKEEADKKGINSIEYFKYDAMETLLCEFDKSITEFNNKFDPKNSREKNMLEILLLVSDFQLAFLTLEPKKLKIIFTPRNNNQILLNKFVHFSTLGLGFTAGTLLSGPLLGLGMLIPGVMTSNVARDQTGINNPTPKSAMILVHLIKEMENILMGCIKILPNTRYTSKECSSEFIFIEKEKFSMGSINPNDYYIVKDGTSLEVIYTNSNKEPVQLNITQYIKEQFLKEIQQESKQESKLSIRHKVVIAIALFKLKYATEYEEPNQENVHVQKKW